MYSNIKNLIITLKKQGKKFYNEILIYTKITQLLFNLLGLFFVLGLNSNVKKQ